jgi:predicted ribosomally synthesized peptide with SipW-like signal peptide
MKNTRVVLVWVCVLAVAGFTGGAATYAQLSDTETVSVSVTAGTPSPTETPVAEIAAVSRETPELATDTSTATTVPTTTDMPDEATTPLNTPTTTIETPTPESPEPTTTGSSNETANRTMNSSGTERSPGTTGERGQIAIEKP